MQEIYTSASFSQVIDALKIGHIATREGWNGKGMFIYYVKPGAYPAVMDAIKGQFADNLVPYGGYIAMKTAQGNVVPWIASQTDLLSNDWIVRGVA